MGKKVLIPIPSTDFDPTECAVPWKLLRSRGIQIDFATPTGRQAHCDLRMIDGNGLGVLAPLLIADKNGRQAYLELEQSSEFHHPISWDQIESSNYDGIILPGGHAQGMKEYLESKKLQQIIPEFFSANKTVGAICHGVVLAVRSKLNGESVLKGRRTTALLKTQEMLAWSLTCLWLGSYYRTYNQTVEDEVTLGLESADHFMAGPTPMLRDSIHNIDRGFIVRDGNYLSARWPGDAHRFAIEFFKMLG